MLLIALSLSPVVGIFRHFSERNSSSRSGRSSEEGAVAMDISELLSAIELSKETLSSVVPSEVDALQLEESSSVIIADSPTAAVPAPEPRVLFLTPRDILTSRNALASAVEIGRRSNAFHALCLSMSEIVLFIPRSPRAGPGLPPPQPAGSCEE